MITTLKQKPYNYGIRKGKPPLTYNNISNCITSAPELVKWKWNNNVFTLEAGSIVTWCAGKEPPTLGVGDIYNGMPIVGISWDGTDLYYYCQTQEDYPWDWHGNYTGYLYMFLSFGNNSLNFWGLAEDGCQSGSTPPTAGNINYYNDSTNRCLHTANGDQSLPLLKVYCKPNIGAMQVSDVYNTGLVMGNTAFFHKDVLTKLTKKLNSADCSLESFEYKTPHIYKLHNANNLTRQNSRMFFGYVPSEKRYFLSINTINNYYSQINEFQSMEAIDLNYICEIAKNIIIVNGKYYSYSPRMPFKAADVQDLQGRFVTGHKSLFTGVTIPSGGTYDFSLADYLPNDGCMYEVYLSVASATSATAGNSLNMYCGSELITTNICLCRQQTRTNSSVNCGGNAIVPVGVNRKIRIGNTGSAPALNTSAVVCGYRKIV